MPVRVYDIAKKLGLESKEILVKAKEMGIAAAKVPSSSLDKITAEWLEEEIIRINPAVAARLAPKPVEEKPKPEPVAEEILIVSAPPPAPEPPAVVKLEPVAEIKIEPAPAPVVIEPPKWIVPPPAPKPVVPVPPPSPPKPQVGDLVGRITLPTRPGSSRPGERERGGERSSSPQPRPPAGVRSGQPQTRGDGRQQFQRGRDGRPLPGSQQPAKPAAPQAPKLNLPSDAQVITIKPPIIVRALADALKQKPFAIIAELMKLRVMATVNQSIDEKIAQQVCAHYGFKFEAEKRAKGEGIVHQSEKKVELDVDDKPEDLKPRAPVVTIMGHVDHGKTSLLDVIRKANVVAGEAGGITQHIGAYTIAVPHPERKNELAQITFLDTPGHAAFSSMRARGANVTDIVVLVVAANDGVMPQTLEALAHARAAKVPILVAVNKIDHPNANSLKVRQQLQEKGLVPDDWGGDTIFVECSALTKQGIDKLLEMILLQADLLELKANPDRNAKGNVIESGVSPGGPTATVLVRKGTLHLGDVVICGEFYGKVRALINEEGQRLKEAGPSVAVSVLGLNGVPDAGWEFSSVDDEKAARVLAEERGQEAKSQDLENRSKVTLENLFASLEAAASKVLRVVVKADTQGSVEAIVEALKKIDSDKVIA